MENFTKYEIARIIGARALQLAMNAPILIKLSDEKMKEIKYDTLKIAELELEASVLPITISRPTPKKSRDKLGAIKEEQVSDEELAAKAREEEKEIVEEAKEMGFVNEGEEEEELEGELASESAEEQ